MERYHHPVRVGLFLFLIVNLKSNARVETGITSFSPIAFLLHSHNYSWIDKFLSIECDIFLALSHTYNLVMIIEK